MINFREKFDEEKLWYKRAKIIQSYHLMKCIEFPRWTLRDTAREFGVSLGHVSEDICLAEKLDEDPLLNEMSRNAALKRIRSHE